MSGDPERVLLCGAAGWLGSAILEALVGTEPESWSVRAFDTDEGQWAPWAGLPPAAAQPPQGRVERRYGSIADYDTVRSLVEGCDAVIHAAAWQPGIASGSAAPAAGDVPWLVNVKGLWNLLDCAAAAGTVRRVVHIGSCHTVWPGSWGRPGKGEVFLQGDVRRPDASVYAATKRAQEELCHQFYDAHGLSTVILRPDTIIDLRHRVRRDQDTRRDTIPLEGPPPLGNVCRHDIAAACCAAISPANTELQGVAVLHVATVDLSVEPAARATAYCNVGEAARLLGVSFEHSLADIFGGPRL